MILGPMCVPCFYTPLPALSVLNPSGAQPVESDSEEDLEPGASASLEKFCQRQIETRLKLTDRHFVGADPLLYKRVFIDPGLVFVLTVYCSYLAEGYLPALSKARCTEIPLR